MGFRKLSITGWKQFDEIDLDFHDRLTILTGANGSGKTTLLNLLARHFGWNFTELSTPVKDKSSGAIKWFQNLFKKISGHNDTVGNPNKMGEIHYDNGLISNLLLDPSDGPQYQIRIERQQSINGLNIVSHRDIFRYQRVDNIPTAKRSRKQAYQIVLNNNANYYTQAGHYHRQNVNFSIKETLLGWAIGGEGNSYVEPDAELMRNFEDFQSILGILFPKSIGFKNIIHEEDVMMNSVIIDNLTSRYQNGIRKNLRLLLTSLGNYITLQRQVKNTPFL